MRHIFWIFIAIVVVIEHLAGIAEAKVWIDS
jgi:hypothetical protein